MNTPIGRQLRTSAARACAAVLLAAGILAVDLGLIPDGWVVGMWMFRLLVGLVVLLMLGLAGRESLGVRLAPVQGWGYWCRTILAIGLIVGGVSLALLVIGRRMGYTIDIGLLAPLEFASVFWRACVEAPLVEEAIYRLVLCTAVVAIAGFWPAVAISGLAFGYMHIRYGCAAPDNLIAGFFLGWAYLRSGTFVIPVLMHALGNLCVLLLQLAIWCRQAGLF